MVAGARCKNLEINVRERSTEPKLRNGWGKFRMRGSSEYSLCGMPTLFGVAERHTSYFLFGMPLVRMPAQRFIISRDCGFSRPSRQMPGQNLKLGPDSFLPHPLYFTIHKPTTTLRYTTFSVEKSTSNKGIQIKAWKRCIKVSYKIRDGLRM
jgi:hypothetical protein